MRSGAGFSLIELIISVGILLIVATLVLASYPKFSDNAELAQAARTIVSSIRAAQFYGISVKETSGSFPSYGIYIGASLPTPSYLLFADTGTSVSENYYSSLDGDKVLEYFSVENQAIISDICIYGGVPGNLCKSDGVNGLHIVFKRPYPDIFIYGEVGGSPLTEQSDYVEITVKSARGDTKQVVVWRSGQVYSQ